MQAISYKDLDKLCDQVLIGQDLTVNPVNRRSAANRLLVKLSIVDTYDEIYSAAHAGATMEDVIKEFDLLPRSDVAKMYQKARSEITEMPQPEVEDTEPIADDLPFKSLPKEVTSSMPQTRDIDQVMAERVIECLARIRGASADDLKRHTQLQKPALVRTVKALSKAGVVYKKENDQKIALTKNARVLLQESMVDDGLPVRAASAIVRESFKVATDSPGENVDNVAVPQEEDDDVQDAVPFDSVEQEPDPGATGVSADVTEVDSVQDAVPFDSTDTEPDPGGAEVVDDVDSVQEAQPFDSADSGETLASLRRIMAEEGMKECPECKGTGDDPDDGAECDKCEGTGEIEDKKAESRRRKRADDDKKVCPTCDGDGDDPKKNEEEDGTIPPCPDCDGTGEVKKEGSRQSRRNARRKRADETDPDETEEVEPQAVDVADQALEDGATEEEAKDVVTDQGYSDDEADKAVDQAKESRRKALRQRRARRAKLTR